MSDRKYQILKLVAKGGTAVLYTAVQTSLDRVVAIKKLHQHLTEDENFTRRFVLEAKAAASLDHENIVKIIDFGVENNSYQMVMEFIEGESLRGILDKWKQLPTDVALAIVYCVCQGLEHAHNKGIVHRDIKPGNIMMTNTGRVKITDFGLAKLTQQTTQHTAVDSILGTPLYMSPEQAFGESVDHRSDLFSLGTMLYEMLTGVQPFRDEHYMAVIQNIIKRNAPHPSKFNAEIPPPVQSLLAKAMNKSRDARFQSAGDFKKAIEKELGLRRLKESGESLRQLLNTDGETLVLPRTVVGRTRQRRLRRGFIVALVTATLFGAAGAGFTLGPVAFQKQVRTAVSWIGEKVSLPQEPGDHMSAMPGDLMNPYMAALDPDTAAVPAAPDSIATMTANTSVVDTPEASGAGVNSEARQSEPQPRPAETTPVATEPQPRPAETTPVATEPQPRPAETTLVATEPQPRPATAQKTAAPEPEEAPTRVKVRKGWLSVTATPSAEIYINGAFRGMTPPALNVELPRGSHRLECRMAGYISYTETVHITADELSSRNIVLKKPRGWLSMSTTAGAEVSVDGSFVGVTPLGKALKLDAGTHQVTLKKAGFNVWNNQITIIADETLLLRIMLSPLY
jgi:tRNA A-37 threonylcarbamoyl transferase component Bud32/outer membrane biosynthesis protein TonB